MCLLSVKTMIYDVHIFIYRVQNRNKILYELRRRRQSPTTKKELYMAATLTIQKTLYSLYGNLQRMQHVQMYVNPDWQTRDVETNVITCQSN